MRRDPKVDPVGFVGAINPKLSALRIVDRNQWMSLVIRVLKAYQGNVTKSAKFLKTGLTTLKRWIKETPELEEALEEALHARRGE